MKVLLKTIPGIEDIVLLDVKEILNREGKVIGKSKVEVEVKDFREIVKLNYLGRSFTRVLLLLKEFEIKNLEDIYREMLEIPFEEYLSEDLTFAIRGERSGEHEFTSMDIGKPAGQAVIDRIKEVRGYRQKVNLDDPDVIFRVIVEDNKCSVYLDTTGDISLHRRGYRIWRHPSPLNPILAYAMVRISGWNPEKENLLDPFCGGGTIPIEAVLWALKIPPGRFRKNKFAFLKLPFFEKEWLEEFEKEERDIDPEVYCTDKSMTCLRGAESNARYAGVLEKIKFSRYDLEWIDIKFREEHSIDKVVTDPPYGVRWKERDLKSIYRDFFWQMDYLLKEDGKIVIISTKRNLIEEYSRKYGFEIENIRYVLHGSFYAGIYEISRS